MRIALIRQRYNPFGGAERFVERASAALVEQGAEITIIARDWAGVDRHARGGRLPTFLRVDPPHAGRLLRDWSFARAVCALVRRERFDLVQSHERLACADIVRAGDGVHREWLAERARVQSPFAAWRTRWSPYHRYVLAAERRMFENPRLAAVVCNSAMVRDEIARGFRIDPAKLRVIYNGVDLARFKPRPEIRSRERAALGIAEDAPLYLFVGSGFERKGVDRTLESFARLPGDAARLVVVGADHALEAMRALAARLGLAPRVHFTGGLADVTPMYAAADCLVLPTLYEPFGNVVLEALACGLPVVTSTRNGAAEVIEPGVNGYVCDALDRAGLAAAMTDVLALDPAGRRAAARRTAEAYSIEAMAERLIGLYRDLLAGRPSGEKR